MIKKEIIVEKDRKIVNVLQDYGFSFVDVSKMLRNKDVRINGKVTKENVIVNGGDAVTFYYSEEMLGKKYEILFESEDVYIVFKNAGIESAGEKGVEGALKGAVAVHRLDRNTEGLLVFAKKEDVAEKLRTAFEKHLVHKYYLAEVLGEMKEKDRIYRAYLLKDSENSFVTIYDKKEKGTVEILTKVDTIKSGKESSLVQVELLTGKTHQIRAHLAFLGHAIIGDGKYGKNENNKKFQQKRQKLACFKLKFDYVGVKSLDFKEFLKYPKWYQMG